MGVARAYIKFDTLLNAFVKDNFLEMETSYCKAIPQDAEILNGGYDEKTARFFVDFEHPDFEDYEDFEVKPQLYYIDELFTTQAYGNEVSG
jgi:hypothetical protein